MDKMLSKMLEIKNLMIWFENAIAINDISLEVNTNEIVAVLGPNSAGKTTLMHAISGLIIDIRKKEFRKGGERITILGEMKFEGEDILYKSPIDRIKKGISLSRERHPVFPDSTVEENLKISTYLRRDKEIKKSFDFIYFIFPHLKSLRKRKAGFCSGGEQQMLSIAMALMAKPKLLLLDEPLLGLSPVMQKNVVQAIKQIQMEGTNILITEQYARPILPIIHRGYVITNGVLILQGTSEELMENPEVRSAFMGMAT
jgi:branched-chain amino acid transport system ATP-binding protein